MTSSPTPTRTGNPNIGPTPLRRYVASPESRLEALDDRHVGRAAALAHRLKAVASAGAFQRVQHGGEKLCAGGSQRVTKGNRPTTRVDLRRVGSRLLEP